MRKLEINGHKISDDTDCYVIAEIGHNHQGDVEKCKQLFKAAKEAGANAVKLQKRSNKDLFTAAAYNKPYENPNSFGTSYGEHREFLEFERDEYLELQKYAKELKVDFFATAFDFPSADFLAKLDVPAFKMASGDIRTIPLLKHVAKFGKPMIVSTGGATFEDVQRAYDAIMPINHQLTLLQCTAGYPPEWSELNLNVIKTFREAFPDVVVGFSSHDNGIAMAVAAYVLGARVIEKHFTLNRAWKGTDHAFSLEPIGLRKMVRDLQRTRVALGDGRKKTYDSEVAPVTKMGKSLVASRDLPKGHVLTPGDVAMKSPGGGVPPYEFERLVGQRLKEAVPADGALKFEILSR